MDLLYLIASAGGLVLVGGAIATIIRKRAEEALARDAARYRHMRSSWTYRGHKHRLEWTRVEWYLPRWGSRVPLGDQLDHAIDCALADAARGIQ